MIHKIRTPKTAILGFADNMLDSDQPQTVTVRVEGSLRCVRDRDFTVTLSYDGKNYPITHELG